MNKRLIHVTKEHNAETRKLLTLMGVPIVEAPGMLCCCHTRNITHLVCSDLLCSCKTIILYTDNESILMSCYSPAAPFIVR